MASIAGKWWDSLHSAHPTNLLIFWWVLAILRQFADNGVSWDLMTQGRVLEAIKRRCGVRGFKAVQLRPMSAAVCR